MNKKKLFGMIPLIAGGILSMFVTACQNPAGDDPPSTVTATPRYNTVPYIPSTAARAAAAETYRLVYSAKDSKSNYYVYLLGHVNYVPIAYRQAVVYNGITPMTIGYSKTTATETVITESVAKAYANSVSKSTTITWGVTVSSEFKVADFAKLGVSASVGGEHASGTEETRSVENTYETAVAKSIEESDTIDSTIGDNNEPAGKYRYSLFGTVDVYYVLVTDLGKTKVEDSYVTFCARPRSYAWGIDYEPDMAGSFGKTAPGDLLEVPAVKLADLPSPKIEADQDLIPPPPMVSVPEAAPGSGSYNAEQAVTLFCPTDGATIYYTTDGTEPTKSSKVYSTPIQVKEGSATIRAIAVKDDYRNSPVMNEVYTVTIPQAVAKWTNDTSNQDKKIDDDNDYYIQYYTSNLDLEKLKAAGYDYVKITMVFDAKRVDYCYAYLDLYIGHGTNVKVGNTWIKEDPPKSWTNYTHTVDKIPIGDYDNKFTAKYSAGGVSDDEWTLGHRVATVEAFKGSR